MRRAARRRGHRVFIGVWVPEPVATAVAHSARTLDYTRSQFLRAALEEKLRKDTGGADG